MTIERAVEELAALLGEFDSDKQDQVTEILERVYDDAHEAGFEQGQVAERDYFCDHEDEYASDEEGEDE